MKSRFLGLLSFAAAALLCLSLPNLPAATSVPRFAYVPNVADNTVSIFTVDASTGQLRDNGYVLAGHGPRPSPTPLCGVPALPKGEGCFPQNYA
jgi:hypothetical protein